MAVTESFEDLFEDSLKTVDLAPESIITGIVINIDKEWVTVYAGLKSEGVIPISEFLDPKGHCNLSINDEVEVALETIDDGLGNTRLSREKARRIETWRTLEHAFKTETPVPGVINGEVKGGFVVELEGMRGFLPGSLVDTHPLREVSRLTGQDLKFRIIRLEPERDNIVLSRRAVLEEENSGKRQDLLASLAEGQVHKGVVKNLTEYGAFVDIGGVDGLLHITDMSWKRVNRPEDVVAVGDELEVQVLKFDREKQRISLGIKQMQDDPWKDLQEKYPPGTRLQAKVTKVVEYGCFAEVAEGIEGLVHASEMDWTSQHVQPSRLVQSGDQTEVMVLEVDITRHRISLSIKQCMPNPWQAFSEQHDKGDRLQGEITSITDFGLFVGLAGGINGLVHISELSWDENENTEASLRRYKKGDQVEVMLLAVDSERERVALGIKQLHDSLPEYLEQHALHSAVSGTVTKVLARSATVTLAEGVAGILRAAEVDLQPVEDVRQQLSIGDTVEAQIIDVDHKLRRVVLSIKALKASEEKQALKDYREQTEQNEKSGTRLGDLLKDEMAATDKKT